jgi:hypothetical protein
LDRYCTFLTPPVPLHLLAAATSNFQKQNKKNAPIMFT